MSTRTCARALVPALLLASHLLHAADHPIHVVNPFAYATPPGAPTAAAEPRAASDRYGDGP